MVGSLGFPGIATFHSKPYPAISPLRPELSQAGRTVLITGASSGIGFAIARGFIQASAARVIITGRNEATINEAVSNLASEVKAATSLTTITGLVYDVASLSDTERLWAKLKNEGIYIDVLILNAASIGAMKPLLEASLESVWQAMETNVRSHLDFTQRFYNQGGDKKKYLVNVSTSAIHNFFTEGDMVPTYSLSKNAGTLLIQQVAKDADPAKLQLISFNPGGILTTAAKNAGYTEDSLAWDDGTFQYQGLEMNRRGDDADMLGMIENLPGQWAVWGASDEAKFLHGRFVNAWWDVDELKSADIVGKLEADRHLLRVGVVGIQAIPRGDN
ncbi:hypothetical protein B0T22DRAFT_388608 [Podospora appendiculata]|uniref:Uncharacterized protein n=1 Tax=Podospora appendiculata TaxID=314037 RepID=A0AAE0WZF4_9PEZI|nr:hypothetical protein B0T22DRAFT_388608 [Podospora appendiculata]